MFIDMVLNLISHAGNRSKILSSPAHAIQMEHVTHFCTWALTSRSLPGTAPGKEPIPTVYSSGGAAEESSFTFNVGRISSATAMIATTA